MTHCTYGQPTVSDYRSPPLSPGLSSVNARSLTCDVHEGIPGDVSGLAVQVEVGQGALAVALVEIVPDVPTQRTKLLPLLERKTRTFKKTRPTCLTAAFAWPMPSTA